MWRAITRLSDVLNKVVLRFLTVLLMLMVIVINVQVFCRYVMNASLSWSEEVARYMFVWIVLLGASIGIKEWFHISVTFLVDRFPSKIRFAIDAVIKIMIAAFSVVLFYASCILVKAVSAQISAALGLPVPILYLCMPITSFLIFLHIVSSLADQLILKGKNEHNSEAEIIPTA
ncbi:C4-dicarboxylate ABC transporter permease [Synergistales bacterium]|nr:C4-dicarboxylate ABC transporter permease [Synergistales bacterium]